MKAPLLSALLTVIANAALTHAFYGPSDNVLELTPQNFGPAILDTNVIQYNELNLYRRAKHSLFYDSN